MSGRPERRVRRIRTACPSALIVIDGAHAVGHVPVNVGSLDPDFYLFSGHKWLFGPATLGVLVVGSKIRSNQSLYEQVVAECYESLAVEGRRIGESGSTVALEPFVGLAEFIATTGKGALREQIQNNLYGIRAYLENGATSTSAFSVLRFPNIQADMVAPGTINVQGHPYTLSEESLHRVRDMLEEKYQVIVKVVSKPLSLRLCVPFYLGLAECERVVRALQSAFRSVVPRAVGRNISAHAVPISSLTRWGFADLRAVTESPSQSTVYRRAKTTCFRHWLNC